MLLVHVLCCCLLVRFVCFVCVVSMCYMCAGVCVFVHTIIDSAVCVVVLLCCVMCCVVGACLFCLVRCMCVLFQRIL